MNGWEPPPRHPEEGHRPDVRVSFPLSGQAVKNPCPRAEKVGEAQNRAKGPVLIIFPDFLPIIPNNETVSSLYL